jgi:hypothetical protein
MNNVKRIIFLSTFSIILLFSFLMPRTIAQEWTYDGADTEHIPGFSVYPSEWYIYNSSIMATDLLSALEVTHGNISDPFMMGNGTCIWGNGWELNTTSGEKTLESPHFLIAYWNESIGYSALGGTIAIPVENDGKVSPSILGEVSVFLGMMLSSFNMENLNIYPNIYSIAFWNDTNSAYVHFNYTDDGILKEWESYLLPLGNVSLYSQPAQLPPVFSFVPEHGNLIVNSTSFILDIDITLADNNNDGVADADYLMRHLQGSTWTDWGTPPSQLFWSLGTGASVGNYTITIEVKNMYGVTQEQIEIQYIPPEDSDKAEIPGFSIVLISLALLLGISFLVHKNRNKI